MLFEFGFYSALLLIPFSQGLLYSVLLLVKGIRNDSPSNYWLSSFLLLCCLYIAPWMLGFGGWYDNQPYRDLLFYVPFHHLFFFGPVIYFYTQSLLNKAFALDRKSVLHFVPGILYLVYSLAMWLYDFLIFKGYYFYADGRDKDFDAWYRYSGLLSMALYLIASLRYYETYRKLVYHVTSFAESILFNWIRTYLVSFLILILLPLVFEFLGYIYPPMATYKGNWWFFLAFSIIMYYLAITAYANPIVSKISFKVKAFGSDPILLTDGNNAVAEIIEEAVEGSNAFPDLEKWKVKVEELICQKEWFKNPELTLNDIASELDTNVALISKVINQGYKMNFNDLINSLRIEAVKKSFGKDRHKTTTMLGIALECGFNSKATFNRAFKKHTGSTPKEYLSQKM